MALARSCVRFLCLEKMTAAIKLAKFEVCAVVQFFMAKHYSTGAINQEIGVGMDSKNPLCY